MMRVLTTTMCYPTPAAPDQGVFVQRRTAALGQRNDIKVVAPQLWCPLLRHPPAASGTRADAGAPAVSYPRMLSIPVLGWATDGVAYARAVCRATNRLGRIDLIDAHFEYPDGVGAYLAARRLRVPVVVTLRGKLVSLARSVVRRPQIQAMLRGADGLIAVSGSLATLARELAGCDLRVDVIPNGVDASVFHPVSRSTARGMLSWRQEAPYALCVGHYQRLKGFDRLVDAWPAVLAANPEARLVLVGSRRGERRFYSNLEQAVNTAGLGGRVALLDAVSPKVLNLMYAAADITVNASRSEGWCNAISESLAAGTPVVATDVGGNREQIASSELGVIVTDGGIAALAEAIVAALARTWNRSAIAARGSARNWDHVANEVTAVFERVVNAHAAARSAATQCVHAATATAAGGAS